MVDRHDSPVMRGGRHRTAHPVGSFSVVFDAGRGHALTGGTYHGFYLVATPMALWYSISSMFLSLPFPIVLCCQCPRSVTFTSLHACVCIVHTCTKTARGLIHHVHQGYAWQQLRETQRWWAQAVLARSWRRYRVRGTLASPFRISTII